MMRRHFNSKFYLLLLLVFMLFTLLFTQCKEFIEAFNMKLFAVTGEALVKRKGIENESTSPQQKTGVKESESVKPNEKPASIKSVVELKPKTLNAPKTPDPTILYIEREPDFIEDKIPEFPELRTDTGEKWDKEKTRIRMTCDGENLYVNVLCFDSDKASLVTEYSKNEGASSAWKDDSVELFIMKDAQSDHYCQYIASASGKTHVFYVEPGVLPYDFAMKPAPTGFTPPMIDSVLVPNGYEVEMRISLSNIGLSKVKPDQKILLQFVRNYRGEHKDGVNLQLFPCYIYADMNIPPGNHDRRAFLPVTVRK